MPETCCTQALGSRWALGSRLAASSSSTHPASPGPQLRPGALRPVIFRPCPPPARLLQAGSFEPPPRVRTELALPPSLLLAGDRLSHLHTREWALGRMTTGLLRNPLARRPFSSLERAASGCEEGPARRAGHAEGVCPRGQACLSPHLFSCAESQRPWGSSLLPPRAPIPVPPTAPAPSPRPEPLLCRQRPDCFGASRTPRPCPEFEGASGSCPVSSCSAAACVSVP